MAESRRLTAETGEIPEANMASWSCSCGESGLVPYARITGRPVALRLAGAFANKHLKEVDDRA